MLYPLLKIRNILFECKIIIYNSILKPILLYGSETWIMTDTLRSKITDAKIRVLRTFKRLTKRDKLRNAKMRDELKTELVKKKNHRHK